jgi:hypothetical protein
MNESHKPPIGIPEILVALRRDLEKAQENLKTEGRTALLNVDSAEVELNVSISASTEAGGEVKFAVFGVGFGASAKEVGGVQFIHKIKISLKPAPGGQPIGVAGSKP